LTPGPAGVKQVKNKNTKRAKMHYHDSALKILVVDINGKSEKNV